jgi:hypothetical protein
MFISVFEQPGNEPVVYRGDHYIWTEGEFWIWNSREAQWKAIPGVPDFLTIVNDRAAIVDSVTGQHICNCPPIWVTRHGCCCKGL